jgi:hypothetical protein
MVSSYRPKAASIQFKLDTKYKSGAGDGLRTRYLNLGKVALYRVSYSRPSAFNGSECRSDRHQTARAATAHGSEDRLR